MKIKKGDWFRCIEKSEYSFIKKGKCYQTEEDGRVSVIHSGTNRCHSFEGESIDIHFQKIYTIQDLKDGKVAVVNDGTPEEFLKVMRFAKSKVNFFTAIANIKHAVISQGCSYAINIVIDDFPKQSVKDFLAQLPKEEKKTFEELAENAKKASKEMMDMVGPKTVIPEEKREGEAVLNPLDTINPKHYSFNIKGTPCDLFDIGNAMDLNKEQFTALRYFRKKENQIEDTKKAIKCLQRLIERLERDRK